MRRVAAGLFALALAGPLPAATEGPAVLAEAVAAAALAGSSDAGAIAALAAAISAQETALVALRESVVGAEERERALAFDLARRRAEVAGLALALQRIGRGPVPAPALHPQGPLGAARASATLAWLTSRLQAGAGALAAQLGAIEAERAERARGLGDLEAALGALDAARGVLIAALARRGRPQDDPAAVVPAALARDAETLSALAEGLAAPGGERGPAAPLALDRPVEGRVLRGFREPDAAGVRRPGLAIAAAPLALVTAPAGARVRYAGPFLDYGYVVVLEPRTDVLVILAGLASLETRTGAVVKAGALLGLLGGRALDAQEYLMLGAAGTGETPGETLYIEVRHGEGPVDPSSWLGIGNG